MNRSTVSASVRLGAARGPGSSSAGAGDGAGDAAAGGVETGVAGAAGDGLAAPPAPMVFRRSMAPIADPGGLATWGTAGDGAGRGGAACGYAAAGRAGGADGADGADGA